MQLLLLLFTWPFQVISYNFLVYSPLFGHSHTTFMGALADILTENGHSVTYLAPVVNYKLEGKFAVKLTKNIITTKATPGMIEAINALDSKDYSKIWTSSGSVMELMKMRENFQKAFLGQCQNLFEEKWILEKLSETKFDVLLQEPFSYCPYGIAEQLNIPTTLLGISLSSIDLISYHIGEPLAPSYVPGSFADSGDDMSLLERVRNLIQISMGMYMMSSPLGVERELIKGLTGIELKEYSYYISSAPFVFTNSNPYFDFPHPTIAKNVQIGGVTLNLTELRAAKVDEVYDEVLNRRNKNVLVSFGSMVKSEAMPQEYKDSLIATFKKFPDVTFIWKYENEDTSFAEGVDNVYFSEWLPQTALLNDPRLTAFITHGGLGSTTELAYLGKPALMIPIFGDQYRNCHMLERHGGIIRITKYDLSKPEILFNALQKVVYESKYSESASLLAKILEDQPQNPAETFLKHAEFAAKYGPIKNMDPHGRKLSLIQYYFIDVIAIFLIVTLFFCIVVHNVMKCCLKSEKRKIE